MRPHQTAGIALLTVFFFLLFSLGCNVLVVAAAPAEPTESALWDACMRSPLCGFVWKPDAALRATREIPRQVPAWVTDPLAAALVQYDTYYRNVTLEDARYILAMLASRLMTQHAHPQGLRCPLPTERAIYVGSDEIQCICPPDKECILSEAHGGGGGGGVAGSRERNVEQTVHYVATCADPGENVPTIVVALFSLTAAAALAATIVIIGTNVWLRCGCGRPAPKGDYE